MMRASILDTRDRFSAARMVREYYDRLYSVPARPKVVGTESAA